MFPIVSSLQSRLSRVFKKASFIETNLLSYETMVLRHLLAIWVELVRLGLFLSITYVIAPTHSLEPWLSFQCRVTYLIFKISYIKIMYRQLYQSHLISKELGCSLTPTSSNNVYLAPILQGGSTFLPLAVG